MARERGTDIMSIGKKRREKKIGKRLEEKEEKRKSKER